MNTNTLTTTKVLEIVDDLLTDNKESVINLKEAQVTIAGKTESDATFVAHVSIGVDETGPVAEARTDWNDFKYYEEVAQAIHSKAVYPLEEEMPRPLTADAPQEAA